jgi:hypothetical protein
LSDFLLKIKNESKEESRRGEASLQLSSSVREPFSLSLVLQLSSAVREPLSLSLV